MKTSKNKIMSFFLANKAISQGAYDNYYRLYAGDFNDEIANTFEVWNGLIRWNKGNGLQDDLYRNSDMLGIDGYVFYDNVDEVNFTDEFPFRNVIRDDIVMDESGYGWEFATPQDGRPKLMIEQYQSGRFGVRRYDRAQDQLIGQYDTKEEAVDGLVKAIQTYGTPRRNFTITCC